MGCEFCFGNVYAWCEKYGTEITQAKGFFMSRNKPGAYCMPIGPGNLREALALLREDAARRGMPLKLYGLNTQDIPLLEQACPGKFRLEADRDYFDYIYRREDLANLPGKKFHQKRNHVARFMRENSGWRYEELAPGNLEEALAMERRWARQNHERNPDGFREEQLALERCLEHFEAFQLRGALLRSGGQVIAFTLGEALSRRTFVTHYEKAFAEYTGAYQMINRCFAEHSLGGFEYVNREEDLGNEGLRKAKMSYHPAMVLEKYIAVEI